jgi:NTP pyrophosphatase (non-canonical NTP hydrolase)
MTTEQLRHINTIVEHYGSDRQQDKAIEECSELIKAICKWKEHLDFAEDIVDEVADVIIMCNQLMIIFDCFGEVEERIDYKINRQLKRISKGE